MRSRIPVEAALFPQLFALVFGCRFVAVVSVDYLSLAHVADIFVVEEQHYPRDVLAVFGFYDVGFAVAFDLHHAWCSCRVWVLRCWVCSRFRLAS